ncbi:MAG: Spy/CpxP family protein refolding chaperone [Deltaproteobacteria bacterium]|nr:Spy/CpxP family protein refolding chaperone [Deltaproteobacteria bacterium]
MKNRKRTAFLMVPVLLAGLSGGIAWSQQGEGRRGDGPRVARADGDEERGRRHWRGREGRRGHEGRRGRGGQARMMKRMTERLELTDEQVKKIKDVFTDARKKKIALRADARIAGIDLRQMVSGESVDKAEVGAKVDAIAKVRGDLLRARTDAVLAVREILTPEQIAKADGMLKRLLQGRGGHKGRGRR